MQSAGAQELHSAHWGLAEVLMCGIPWKELMGMGVDMETCTSYGRGTTAETLYLQTPQCCFSAVQWDGCLPWPCLGAVLLQLPWCALLGFPTALKNKT